MQDRQLVQTDHIQETIYDETYGHVGDDVTSHKWWQFKAGGFARNQQRL